MNPSNPTQEDLDDAHDLAWNVLDRAIARYEETRAHADRTWQLLQVDPTLNPWSDLETRCAIEAEHHLTNCILATDPQSDSLVACELERFRSPTRGVRSNGVTYLVTPSDPYATTPGRIGGPIIMPLVVVRGDDAFLDMGKIGTFSQRTRRSTPPLTPPVEPALAEPSVWMSMILESIQVIGEEAAWRRIALAPPKPPG